MASSNGKYEKSTVNTSLEACCILSTGFLDCWIIGVQCGIVFEQQLDVEFKDLLTVVGEYFDASQSLDGCRFDGT